MVTPHTGCSPNFCGRPGRPQTKLHLRICRCYAAQANVMQMRGSARRHLVVVSWTRTAASPQISSKAPLTGHKMPTAIR
jgi:hypothetical protein